MSNKQHCNLDKSDLTLRMSSGVGMEDGVKQVILRICGFELFNTRPYHNYENWSDGYRVVGRKDGAAMTLEEVASIVSLRTPAPDHISVEAEDMDDACKAFAALIVKAKAEATSPAQTGLAAVTAGQEDEPSQPVNDTSSDRI